METFFTGMLAISASLAMITLTVVLVLDTIKNWRK